MGTRVAQVARFKTGLAHYVYDCGPTTDGSASESRRPWRASSRFGSSPVRRGGLWIEARHADGPACRAGGQRQNGIDCSR